jgi:hypothetical protein
VVAVLSWLFGAIFFGLRTMQLVHLFGFSLQLFYYLVFFLGLGQKFNPISPILYLIFLTIYLALILTYGQGDLKLFKIKGPYAVGMRKFRPFKLNYGTEPHKSNADTQVYAFYPVDKTEFANRIRFKQPRMDIFSYKHKVEALDAVRYA